MLWTDESSREFIAEHYAWFLDTFNDYKYNIQRADAIRYFVLHHYGGVYLDLDIGCMRPLDPLLVYPVILPKTIPVGVSNDLMFAEQGHPFLAQTIHNLVTFDHNWILNYPTVMFSTGPMFLSAQYGLYTSSHATEDPVRILPKSLYGKNAKEGEAPNTFFSHFYGSSWHADDAAFIGFLGTWGKGLMWVGLVILIVGVARMMWPGKQHRYGLGMGRIDVFFPRFPSRSGRWHLHLPRSYAGSSASSSPSSPPSPDLSLPQSPTDVDVLHFDMRAPSPSPSDASSSTDYFTGRIASPLVGAFQAVRSRVSSLVTPQDDVLRTPLSTRRRKHNRGVLFFLPAIWTQREDIELGSASGSYARVPTGEQRQRSRSRSVPEKHGLPDEHGASIRRPTDDEPEQSRPNGSSQQQQPLVDLMGDNNDERSHSRSRTS
jgi:inositol phosphorylceramide mannosyltransferase catalytic subunit